MFIYRFVNVTALSALLVSSPYAKPVTAVPSDQFAPLAIYDGEWAISADHPWSGASPGAVDHLTSRCHDFSDYFACEQTINGHAASLIVYTPGDIAGRLYTRTIAPSGLAGGRGDLSFAGAHWTYLDKPPATLKGDWSRTENIVVDNDHINFAEYTSSDEGKNWRLTNSGDERRSVSVRSSETAMPPRRGATARKRAGNYSSSPPDLVEAQKSCRSRR